LLNGTGSVGLAGGGTSARFRALASADLRKPGNQGIPLRFNVNVGYHLDNSGKLVSDVETARGQALGLTNQDGSQGIKPITRIETFGLGINKVASFEMYFGAGAPFAKFQPYLEYSIDIPVNRQGYQCHTSRVDTGDVCLGLADFGAPDVTHAGGPGF